MLPNDPEGLVKTGFWALPLEFLPQWAMLRLGIPISASFPGGAVAPSGWRNTFWSTPALAVLHTPPPVH